MEIIEAFYVLRVFSLYLLNIPSNRQFRYRPPSCFDMRRRRALVANPVDDLVATSLHLAVENNHARVRSVCNEYSSFECIRKVCNNM